MPGIVHDLSANINPLGPPPDLAENWESLFRAVGEYPDPEAAALTEILAAKNHLDTNSVLIGNGGAELIFLTAALAEGGRVLIVQPAFAEYAEACRAYGCDIDFHLLKEPSWQLDPEPLIPRLADYRALYICSPNNPTGCSYDRTAVIRLMDACEAAGCYLIIDEAFYDFTESEGFSAFVKSRSKLILLRSMTKLFAIPGLRLGYALASESVISRLKKFKPHWSVNSLALKAGELCEADAAHRHQTLALIRQEKEVLEDFYRENGFQMSKSSVNFYLMRDPGQEDQMALLQFLLERGVIPRHTYNFPGLDGRWLRFAVKTRKEHTVLMEVLDKWKRRSAL